MSAIAYTSAALMGFASLSMFAQAIYYGGSPFDYATASAAALSAGLLVFIGRRNQKTQENR